MSTLLNLSGKIDPPTVAVLETVGGVITELAIPYVIVGATARDLVLHFGHGASVERATKDVDFAIQVQSWADFNAVKEKLCEQGFKTKKAQHRLFSPMDTMVDIVPFGQIENKPASVAWPPDGDVVMNVLGFQEACDNAEWVRILEAPETDVPVATPAGMILLKIIAWTDRASDIRGRDAADIAYLLSNYEVIPAIREALYEENNLPLMELYEWDVISASANLLGQHAKSIALENTKREIAALVNGNLRELRLEHLAEEMCTQLEVQYDKNYRQLNAFMKGFGL